MKTHIHTSVLVLALGALQTTGCDDPVKHYTDGATADGGAADGLPVGDGAAATKSYSGTIVYKVFESFRWLDEAKPNYKKKVFDVDGLAMTYEPVKSFGATGYGVELN